MRVPGAMAALAAFALIPTVAAAQAASDSVAAPFHAVVMLDQRAQDTGWRLARANAPFCQHVIPAIGLLVQDMQSWENPAAARAAFGVSAETQVTVGAAAMGSPAQEAGLHSGEPLRTIGDTVLDLDLAPVPAGSYTRQTTLHALIDGLLDRSGWVAIGIDTNDGGRAVLRIAGKPVCASRFEIVTEGSRAEADGNRVLVSGKLAAQLADPDEFAFVVAHELAHNLLGHPAMLKETGRSWGRVRHSEREADRLAVWLMANADYDVEGAASFMRGWARDRDVGFLDPTHDAWDERLDGVTEEIALVAAATARPGDYDWSARFPLSRNEAKPGK